MRLLSVGPTGCGKSTFINLLMRFYDVNSGSISVDGKPIRDITRHLSVAVMVWCFRKPGSKTELSATISRSENRKLQIQKSSKQPKLTHSWEFIRRLPKGLDTMLNEDSLSQGQKQLAVYHTSYALSASDADPG